MKNYNAFVQASQDAESHPLFFDACAILFLADHADAPLTIHRLTAATGKTAATLYPALTWLVDRGFLTHTRPAPGRPAEYALQKTERISNFDTPSSLSSSISSSFSDRIDPRHAIRNTDGVPVDAPALSACDAQDVTALAAAYGLPPEFLLEKVTQRMATRHEAFSLPALRDALQVTKANASSSFAGYFFACYVKNGLYVRTVAQESGFTPHAAPRAAQPTPPSVDAPVAPASNLTPPARPQTATPKPAAPAPSSTGTFADMQAILRGQVNASSYKTWIAPCSGAIDGATLALTVPSSTHEYWLSEVYAALIHAAFERVTGRELARVTYRVAPMDAPEDEHVAPQPQPTRHQPTPPRMAALLNAAFRGKTLGVGRA